MTYIDILYKLEESHDLDDSAIAYDLKLEQGWADVYLHNYIDYLPVHLFANRNMYSRIHGFRVYYRSRTFCDSISVPRSTVSSSFGKLYCSGYLDSDS